MKFLQRLPLILLVILLSGCVWLRVLEMKHQLSQFDEHFKIEHNPHFSLHFLHPVLYDEDYLALAKVAPSLKEALPTGSRWKQVFHKVGRHGDRVQGGDIMFTFEFDRNKRLVRWDFSPGFTAMIPSRFLDASLRSLGRGKVDEGRKQLRVDSKDLPKVNSEPPNRQQVVSVLGEPTDQFEENGTKLSVYRFVTETAYVEPDYEDRRNAYAKLYFDGQNDQLRKVSARFLGLKFSVDFQKLIQLEAVGKAVNEG